MKLHNAWRVDYGDILHQQHLEKPTLLPLFMNK